MENGMTPNWPELWEREPGLRPRYTILDTAPMPQSGMRMQWHTRPHAPKRPPLLPTLQPEPLERQPKRPGLIRRLLGRKSA